MLRRAGTEGRANLSIQRSACPKTSGLVQKGGHLRRYPAIARTCADDDGVIVRKFLDSCYGRFLIQLEMGFLRDFLRHSFGDAPDVNRRPCLPCAFRHRLGPRPDVTVSRIIKPKKFRHFHFSISLRPPPYERKK